MTALEEPAGNDTAALLIRRAALDDAAAVSRIHNVSIMGGMSTMQECPTSEVDARGLIALPEEESVMLVLEVGANVVGWGRVWQYSPRKGYRFAAETAIFVDPSFHGKGLGTELQLALVKESRLLGYHHLVAKIFADNAASIRLHLKVGYELVGVQREIGHKGGRWKDVAILQFLNPQD